jgi:hypothetical protein
MLPSFVDALKTLLEWLRFETTPDRRKRRFCQKLKRLYALLKTVLRDAKYLLAAFTRLFKTGATLSNDDLIPIRRVIMRQINNLHKAIDALESLAPMMDLKLPNVSRHLLTLMRGKMEFFDNIGLALDLIYGVQDFSGPEAALISRASDNLNKLQECTERLRIAIDNHCELKDLL